MQVYPQRRRWGVPTQEPREREFHRILRTMLAEGAVLGFPTVPLDSPVSLGLSFVGYPCAGLTTETLADILGVIQLHRGLNVSIAEYR